MGQYTSYWLYQKYETRGSQEPIPCYPNVYSVDGDGTMPLVVRKEDDTQCGYVPPIVVKYRWVNIPITQDFICDECSSLQFRWVRSDDTICIEEEPQTIYRWVNMDASVDYYCEGTTKYYKQKKQISYDSGLDWEDVTPPEYQKGDVAETESTDCGYIPPTTQYRWVNMDQSTDYYCEGTTKYYKQKRQVSYDEGQTWQDVSPAEYQKGDVAETESTDCGYVPPVTQYRWVKTNDTTCIENPEPPAPTGKKLVATYNDDTTREVECNESSTLTSGETRPYYYQAEKMISAVIGDCVTTIGNAAFADNCHSLTNVTIPNSVTSIGDGAFWDCISLTSIDIPSGVTRIGEDAFIFCTGLTSVTVNASTPPTLGDDDVFYDTNNCPIYVPAASVNAYKTAQYWSTYASRIQPIL